MNLKKEKKLPLW